MNVLIRTRWIQAGGAALLFFCGMLQPWRISAGDIAASAVWTIIHPEAYPLFGVREPGFAGAWMIGTVFRLLSWFGVAFLGAVCPAATWWLVFRDRFKDTRAVPAMWLPIVGAALALAPLSWANMAVALAGLITVAATLLALKRVKLAPLTWGIGAILATNVSTWGAALILVGLLWWSQRPMPMRIRLISWAAGCLALVRPGGFSFLGGPAISWHWVETLAVALSTVALPLTVFLGKTRPVRRWHLASLAVLALAAFGGNPVLWWYFSLGAALTVRPFVSRPPENSRAALAATTVAIVLGLFPIYLAGSSWLNRGAAWAGVIPSFWKDSLVSIINEGPLYVNPAGRAPLVLAEIMPPQLAGATGMIGDFRAAQQSPELWRSIDQKIHFGAVFLHGDISSFRPLLAHLIKSPDWRCIHFDHESFVFARRPYQPANLAMIDFAKVNLRRYPVRSRVDFLASIAMRLIECNQAEAAKPYIKEALAIAPGSPRALLASAMERMAASDVEGAMKQTDLALAADRNDSVAVQVKVQLLLKQGRTAEAYEWSKLLEEQRPDDPAALFLRAEAAHALHAYDAEIEVLERLVRVAKSAGYPTAAFRTYLGQAYASRGKGGPAVLEFRAALNEPAALSAEQIQFILEAIKRIEQRTGLDSAPTKTSAES